MPRSLLFTFVVLALARESALAQGGSADVELLGQVHGTRPPAAYFELKARRPEAFQMRGGWARRSAAVRGARTGRPSGASGAVPGAFDSPAAVLGPRNTAVQGTFHFPLILGLFSDSPAQETFTAERVQREFFDGPNTYYRTIPDFYREMSSGRVDLVGHTFDWVRSSLSQSDVTAGQSGLPGQVPGFILQLLTIVDDGSVDWGLFDNDGPDGTPNSGDDDGFVDFLAVMHATSGAECTGSPDQVWSHKWSISSATGNPRGYRTRSVSRNPVDPVDPVVRIDDYTIQPVQACPLSGVPPQINQIGVFAHELGHAFGLPDLYCTTTNCAHAGIGRWGLMGSGAWGCMPPPGHHPERPCHMDAWSKSMMGWVDVETLGPGLDHGVLTLPPVVSSRRVYRVEAGDGSGDYFLLENRQPIGFDSDLPEGGMLVWRIDASLLADRWGTNSVNNDRARMGVTLLQADGRNDLGTPAGNRGDAGDPFPGSASQVVLHTASSPSTLSHLASPTGLTVLDITRAGEDVSFRLLTRFQDVVVRTSGAQGLGGLLTVDGQPIQGAQTVVRAAPFQPLRIEAAPGAPLEPGIRRGFDRWADDPSLPRVRTHVTGLSNAELVAEYGQRREMQVRLSVTGGQFGVSPGTVTASPSSPDSWFPEGTFVTFSAAPTTGFGFLRWSGGLAGETNPVRHQVNAPIDAAVEFELTYRVTGSVSHSFEAATLQEIVLTAQNGSSPITWRVLSGALPDGLTLSSGGTITGAALVKGQFTTTVEARDASGLVATGTLTLDVSSPRVGVEALVGLFLLGTPEPTELQRSYLDSNGNRNGFYDLGDLRIFLTANPDMPLSAQQRAMVRAVLPMVDFKSTVRKNP
jgi:M6 family metalloprotease-like protein